MVLEDPVEIFTMYESVIRRTNFKSILEWLFFLYPLSLAINKHANDVVAALLFLTSCVLLILERHACVSACRMARRFWILALTMPLLLVAIQSVALNPPLALRDFDDYSRFFLCLPVYFAALILRLDIRKFMWGCFFFALYSVPLMVYQMIVMGSGRLLPPNGFLGIIPHTSLAIILSLVALRLAAGGQGFVVTRLVPGVALASALVMPLLTQTRSGFLLLLAMWLLVWALQAQRQLKFLAYIAAAALSLTILVTTMPSLWGRPDSTVAEIRGYATATVPMPLTSATTRIELWRIAGNIAFTHPLIGIGNHRFRDGLLAMKEKHLAPSTLEPYSHPHNDFLKMASEGGLLGALAYILLIGVPLAAGAQVYQRARGISDPAWLVVILASGVLIAGMVDVILVWRPTVMFYGMSMSLLLAYVDNRAGTETT